MAAVQSYGGGDMNNANPQFPSQGNPGQVQHGYPQQAPYGQDGGAYSGQQQQMGQQQHMGQQQQMGTGNYPQGGGAQQMNGGVGQQAPVVDNRDTMTKCNDNPPDL